MDIQHSSCSAKPLVPAAKVNSFDAVLAQHRRTHDAGLDRDIEVRLGEDADGVIGEDTGNGNKLGVTSAVQGAVRLVHASSDDLAVFHEDTANGCFIALEGKFGL